MSGNTIYVKIHLDPQFTFLNSDDSDGGPIYIPDIVNKYISPELTFTSTILNPYAMAGDGAPILVCDNNKDYIAEVLITRVGEIQEDYIFSATSGYAHRVFFKDVVRISEDKFHIVFNILPGMFSTIDDIPSAFTIEVHCNTLNKSISQDITYYYYSSISNFECSISGPDTLLAGNTGSYSLTTNLLVNDLIEDNIFWQVIGDATINKTSNPYNVNVIINPGATVNPVLYCVIIFNNSSSFTYKKELVIPGGTQYLVNGNILNDIPIMDSKTNISYPYPGIYIKLLYGDRSYFGISTTQDYHVSNNNLKIYDLRENVYISYTYLDGYGYVYCFNSTLFNMGLFVVSYDMNRGFSYGLIEYGANTLINIVITDYLSYVTYQNTNGIQYRYNYQEYTDGAYNFGKNLNIRAGNHKSFKIYSPIAIDKTRLKLAGINKISINNLSYNIFNDKILTYFIQLSAGWNTIDLFNNTDADYLFVYRGPAYGVFSPNAVIGYSTRDIDLHVYTTDTMGYLLTDRVFTASANLLPEATYLWTMTNGNVLTGQGTNVITYQPSGVGVCSIKCILTHGITSQNAELSYSSYVECFTATQTCSYTSYIDKNAYYISHYNSKPCDRLKVIVTEGHLTINLYLYFTGNVYYYNNHAYIYDSNFNYISEYTDSSGNINRNITFPSAGIYYIEVVPYLINSNSYIYTNTSVTFIN